MILLELNDKGFRRDFQSLIQRTKNPKGLLLACGRQLTVDLKKHFRNKDATQPNRIGGKRTHYWNQVASSVNQPEIESPTKISVTISDPTFAQKVFGGTITAKRRQYLTIPLTAEAYGHTAGDFVGAFILRTAKGAYIVKHGETITGTGKVSTAKVGEYRIRANLNFLFKLVRSVDQARDPDALPPQTLLEQSVAARGQAFLSNEFSFTA